MVVRISKLELQAPHIYFKGFLIKAIHSVNINRITNYDIKVICILPIKVMNRISHDIQIVNKYQLFLMGINSLKFTVEMPCIY
jgi:hypothetical protein